MNIIISVLIIFTLSFMNGCVSGPAKPATIDNKLVINIPFEMAYMKALQALASEGYPIQYSSKEVGNISSGKKTVKLQTTQADCGKYIFGYLDDDRTVTTVSYAIFLKKLNNGKTEVTVNTEIEGTFQAGAGQTNILNCYSLGVLEKVFLEKLSQ